ncbi:unnamed protein product [Blepharisma stoltei]|uniref:ubiquitinyl hydrolase 1 n=1 Tax=Blepharisma stoltei TaxID=1481888 RepID=A0AAU9IGW9_9CILI|nr:unnamed protein product [Blepharisma stoltei]
MYQFLIHINSIKHQHRKTWPWKRFYNFFPKNIANLENTTKPELVSLKNLIQGLNISDSSSNLSDLVVDFKNEISKSYPMFRGAQENDAIELLVIILSMLDENEMVKNPFNIIYNRVFKCENKHKFLKKEETNLILIPKGAGIQAHLKNVKKEEEFIGDNKLYCEECKENKDIILKTERIVCPKILILYIANDENHQNNTKCVKKVTFGENLYLMYAVICYDSTIPHFYAYERIGKKSWCEYNDNYTSISDSFPEEKAYLLFYRLKD